jgi:hypothetical protein
VGHGRQVRRLHLAASCRAGESVQGCHVNDDAALQIDDGMTIDDTSMVAGPKRGQASFEIRGEWFHLLLPPRR